MTHEEEDTLRSISISPRERLANIELALAHIDEKLDTRFDVVERRLSTVETAQAGQASTAEFLAKARELAEETSQKAAGLAAAETQKAVLLVEAATAKALDLANQHKDLAQSVSNLATHISTNATALEDFNSRQDTFDRKVSWSAGLGAAAVFAAAVAGYFIG